MNTMQKKSNALTKDDVKKMLEKNKFVWSQNDIIKKLEQIHKMKNKY